MANNPNTLNQSRKIKKQQTMKTNFIFRSIVIIAIILGFASCSKEKSSSSHRIKYIVRLDDGTLDSLAIDTTHITYDIDNRITQVDRIFPYNMSLLSIDYISLGKSRYTEPHYEWLYEPYKIGTYYTSNAHGHKYGGLRSISTIDSQYIIDDTNYLQGKGMMQIIRRKSTITGAVDHVAYLQHEDIVPNRGYISQPSSATSLDIHTMEVVDQPQIQLINYYLLRYVARYHWGSTIFDSYYAATYPELIVFGKLFTHLEYGALNLTINYTIVGGEVTAFTVTDGTRTRAYEIIYE